MTPPPLRSGLALACAILGLGLAPAGLSYGQPAGPPRNRPAVPAVVPLRLPSETSIPAGPVGEAIRRGQQILTHTAVAAKPYVGAALSCTSCHLDRGRQAHAAPWVGLWGVFPEYSARSARLELLEDRINDCFERSMNGTPLPRDSDEMRAILAYIRWLSTGVPTGASVQGRGFLRLAPARAPDRARGKDVYAARCAACHGAEGQGIVNTGGEPVFPPLWGARSFNMRGWRAWTRRRRS